MKRIEISSRLHLLAKFANLKSEDVEDFRKSSQAEDFAPDAWWSASAFPMKPGASSMQIWRLEQQRLRTAWATGFKPQAWLELVLSSAKYSEQDAWIKNFSEQMLQMNNEAAFEYASQQTPKIPPAHVYSYYEALVDVKKHPWCAKICNWSECRKYFIADQNKRQYCSSQCSADSILRTKRETFQRRKHIYRPNRKARAKTKKAAGGK